MSRGSRPLVGYVVLLMLSTIVVYGFPVHHVPPGNKLVTPTPFTQLKRIMTRPKYVPLRENQELEYFRDVIEHAASLKGVPKPLYDNSGKKEAQDVIDQTGSSLVHIIDSSIYNTQDRKASADSGPVRVKRCVNCSGNDDVTTERNTFMFDPLAEVKVTKAEDMDATPPSNNSLIILPLMAIIVFIGTVCAKCCRWTQKDVREVGFIVEAKPLKRNTIAKGIMQMHNSGMANRTKSRKKGKNFGIRAPEQFMFLPLLLGQSITVSRPNAAFSRAKSPPKSYPGIGSPHQFQSLTEVYDPGFDASEDTDEEKSYGGRKRTSSSQTREFEDRKSPGRLSKGSRGSSKRSRSTKSTQESIDCPDIELDSSEEERLELEEQCRRGLAVLAHIDPVPLATKPGKSSLNSKSSAGSFKSFSGQRVSVRADVHEAASGCSGNDLKLPKQSHGSRHSSADACVDTHDLIEHIEDYYGVDIRAFINLWHHRRRFANITDAVDIETAAAYARHHEIKRTQSCKKPKKPKPCMKRQVSFPFDLPQSVDLDSPPSEKGVSPTVLSCAVSTLEDEVFKMPEEVKQATPVHKPRSGSDISIQMVESVKHSNVAVANYPELDLLEELRNLPPSPTSSHHSICDDSGYHNHSFSKFVTSPSGPPLRRTSSDDSAVATNLASESSQSNPDGSPRDKLNSRSQSDEDRVASPSLSDLTLKDRLNCQDSQETCASDSMQRTSLQLLDECNGSESQGASCGANGHAHEDDVFSKCGHRPKLKDIVNHVNMSTVGSNDMSDDTEKLLDPVQGYSADFDGQDKPSRKNSGLFNSGKEVPVAFQVGNHEDGTVVHGDGRAGDEDEELFDSSPNAPLLQNSIKKRASREKSSDMENNNEHVV